MTAADKKFADAAPINNFGRHDRRSAARSRPTSSRYAAPASASKPDGGVACPEEPGRRRPTKRDPGTPSRYALGAVVDPEGKGGDVQVTINRDVDVLEQERSARRITEAAYLTGRIAQAAFERGVRVGSSNWGAGSRVDPATAHELAILYGIDSAATVRRIVGRMEAAVGAVGSRFLRSIISEGISFKAAAAARGQTSERAATYAGDRFRMLLEDLAEEWSAVGRTGQQIVAGLADAPDEVRHEPAQHAAFPPLAGGKSKVTASLGRATLDRAATDGDRQGAVRRGIRTRA